MMLVGGLVWAYVLSSMCGIFSSLNPHEAAYKNQMDELTYFMEVQRRPLTQQCTCSARGTPRQSRELSALPHRVHCVCYRCSGCRAPSASGCATSSIRRRTSLVLRALTSSSCACRTSYARRRHSWWRGTHDHAFSRLSIASMLKLINNSNTKYHSPASQALREEDPPRISICTGNNDSFCMRY